MPELFDSWFAILIDPRVIVFLICIAVAAMTAKVWINSKIQPAGDLMLESDSAAKLTLSNPRDDIERPRATVETILERTARDKLFSGGEFDFMFR